MKALGAERVWGNETDSKATHKAFVAERVVNDRTFALPDVVDRDHVEARDRPLLRLEKTPLGTLGVPLDAAPSLPRQRVAIVRPPVGRLA